MKGERTTKKLPETSLDRYQNIEHQSEDKIPDKGKTEIIRSTHTYT
jgi:hypothetical protein